MAVIKYKKVKPGVLEGYRLFCPPQEGRGRTTALKKKYCPEAKKNVHVRIEKNIIFGLLCADSAITLQPQVSQWHFNPNSHIYRSLR